MINENKKNILYIFNNMNLYLDKIHSSKLIYSACLQWQFKLDVSFEIQPNKTRSCDVNTLLILWPNVIRVIYLRTFPIFYPY